MASSGKHVAYYRVSPARQGRSGLGLEAQKRAVAEYLDGGDWKIVGEFTEVESGKRADRPQLAKALAVCRLHGARLVIAKLDRLSRNAHFLLGLKESGVDFVAADMPNANRLTVGIMAMVGENETLRISERTKAALAAAKVIANESLLQRFRCSRLLVGFDRRPGAVRDFPSNWMTVLRPS